MFIATLAAYDKSCDRRNRWKDRDGPASSFHSHEQTNSSYKYKIIAFSAVAKLSLNVTKSQDGQTTTALSLHLWLKLQLNTALSPQAARDTLPIGPSN